MSAGIATVQETPRHKGALRLRSGNKFDVLNSLAAGDKGPGTASRRGSAAEGGCSAGAQRPGAQRRGEEAASAQGRVGELSGALCGLAPTPHLSLPRAPQMGRECSQTPPLATEPEQRLWQPSHTWKSSEIFPLSNWESLLTPSLNVPSTPSKPKRTWTWTALPLVTLRPVCRLLFSASLWKVQRACTPDNSSTFVLFPSGPQSLWIACFRNVRSPQKLSLEMKETHAITYI